LLGSGIPFGRVFAVFEPPGEKAVCVGVDTELGLTRLLGCTIFVRIKTIESWARNKMLMGKAEFLLSNNPIRAYIQDRVEASEFRRSSSLPDNKTVLEIGCGNGTGTKLINKYFSPTEIHAVDLDGRMIDLAKKRNDAKNTFFEVGDVGNLWFENNHFDAIFDFGAMHHIPNWKDCLAELKRVLKPGGELLISDSSIETFETFTGRIMKQILRHPYDKMFQEEEFTSYLKTIGFRIEHARSYNLAPLHRFFILIATKR